MLDTLLGRFTSADQAALLLGLILLIGLLLALRAVQVLRQHGASTDTTSAADNPGRLLLRWGGGVLALSATVFAVYTWYWLPRAGLLAAILAPSLPGTPIQSQTTASQAGGMPAGLDAETPTAEAGLFQPADSTAPLTSTPDAVISNNAVTLPTLPSYSPQLLADMRLIIPRLALDSPVLEAPFVGQQWDVSHLRQEVGHLAGTAYPGQPGNAVLAGHVTLKGSGPGPFYELSALRAGDIVLIQTGEQQLAYQVTLSKVVEPLDVAVAFPTDDTRLTLITCIGWNFSLKSYEQRIVIVAKPAP